VEIPEKDSLADALLGGIGLDNQYTFELTRRHIDQSELVAEKEIADGMFHAYDQQKLVVEGAGAVGISAVLGGKISGSGPAVIVVSGGNADPKTLCGIAAERYKL
jgi:threonine dehydratase